jgi:L-threonylcarbamoyladenylate synthase
MRMLGTTEEDLAVAGDAIARGLLVAIPTENVYGLGDDAFSPEAVARIFEAKARPSFDPLIVHICRLDQAAEVARAIPPKARALMESLWPGPLTLILPKRAEVPDLVSSGLDTVAIRFPSHPVARRVIERSGTAVAAPSANPFGYLSPTTAAHVVTMLGEKVDFIVDGGACPVGVESTVLDMTGDIPTILRPGGMELDAIRAVIGDIHILSAGPGVISSPGQSLRVEKTEDCARRIMVFHLPRAVPQGEVDPARSAALVFDGSRARTLRDSGVFGRVECLSEEGSLREAAARLFSILHVLDAEGRTQIWAERVPQHGLGPAINDRLYKASWKG